MKRRYWIGVASLNHVQIGVNEGFSQVCHGKKKPLQRMKENDVIFYYSPTIRLGSNVRCQCFTAMGRIRDDKVYQVEMSSNFVPFRRNVEFYLDVQHASIHNLISQLDFIEKK
ncbi:TPA: EVE domain-containing protein [Enterococcus faecium]